MQYTEVICAICNTPFKTKTYRLKQGRGKYCSKNCRIKAQSKAISGSNHPRWKNGIWIKNVGHTKYKFIRSPNHPNRTVHGYVREHILVIEKYLGRYLKPTEIIHHLNGNGLDNRLENLKVTDRTVHQRIHRLGKPLSEETRRKLSIAISKARKEKPWYPSEMTKMKTSETMKKVRLQMLLDGRRDKQSENLKKLKRNFNY